MHLTSLVSALALGFAVVSAQAPTNTVLENVQALNGTVAGKDYKLSTALRLAGSAQPVVDALGSTTNFTLFAPTDKAFEEFGAANPKVLLALAANQTALEQALFYHVVSDVAFSPIGAPAKQFVKTAESNYLGVDVDGKKVTLMFDGGNATVVDSIPSSNGVIHVISSVLRSPRSAAVVASEAGLNTLVEQVMAANLTDAVSDLKGSTLFAPTDKAFDTVLSFAKDNNIDLNPNTLAGLLKFHVVPGVYFSTDIIKAKTASLATLLAGQNVTVTVEGDNVKVVGSGQTALKLAAAEVKKADVLVNGGVAHVIDAVLIPDLNAAAANTDAPTAAEGKGNAAGAVSASLFGVAAAVAAAVLAL